MTSYPQASRERTEWILKRRHSKEPVDPRRPVAFFAEQEPEGQGGMASVGTILLANKECPWKCLMCDLWKHTLDRSVAPGDIPAQIEYALSRLPKVEVLKLYNAGSFFDPAAIPTADYKPILELVSSLKRVIVECHPKLIGPNVFKFGDGLAGELEVAIGMETVHPGALDALNKRIELSDIKEAFDFLLSAGIRSRAFLLVHPPFVDKGQEREWLGKSVIAAAEMGASAISLIPTRATNGAMERLILEGAWNEPLLSELEWGLDFALSHTKAICLADTWDLERFSRCEACFEGRKERLHTMNLFQKIVPAVSCSKCSHE